MNTLKNVKISCPPSHFLKINGLNFKELKILFKKVINIR